MSRVKPIVVALTLALVATHARSDDPGPPRKGLAAKIVVKSKSPLKSGRLEWELVLTNEGKRPIRVCTLSGGWRTAWEGHYEETFGPDCWKSDRPWDEEFDKHIVTLKAGQSASLPASVGDYRGEGLAIKAAYEVGKDFAARHRTWEGKVEAKPLVLRATKPK